MRALYLKPFSDIRWVKPLVWSNIPIDNGQPWPIEFQTRGNVLTHEKDV